MAEMFGAVASGIGVAGVAAQALDGIHKLQTFVQDVRDAPEELQYMIEQLENLLNVIVGIDNQVQQSSRLSQVNLTPALRFCRRSVESTASTVEHLNNDLMQGKTLARFKTAWRKRALESYMTKIDRATNTLTLAVSAYIAEVNLRTEDRLDQLSIGLMCLTTSQNPQLALAPSISQIGPRQKAICDSETHGHTSQPITTAGRIPILTFSLALPYWLMRRAWQIEICRAAQVLTINLRTYRLVPDDCELWNATRNGDVEEVCELLDSGQATVFDRDIYGRTVLHKLALSAGWQSSAQELETLDRLIWLGADVNACDEYQSMLNDQLFSLPVHSYNIYTRSSDKTNLSVEFYRRLTTNITLDPDAFWDALYVPDDPEIVSLLKHQVSPWSDNDQAEFIDQRIGCAMFTSPASLAVWLGVQDLETAYLESDLAFRKTLMRSMMAAWGSSCSRADQDLTRAWQLTICGLAGEVTESNLRSPFEWFILGFVCGQGYQPDHTMLAALDILASEWQSLTTKLRMAGWIPGYVTTDAAQREIRSLSDIGDTLIYGQDMSQLEQACAVTEELHFGEKVESERTIPGAWED